MKDVFVTVNTLREADGDNDIIEISADGKLAIRDGKYLLSYKQNIPDGLGVLKTRIIAEENKKITVIHSGNVETRMVIEKNKSNRCVYSTAQGAFKMEIIGENIENSLSSIGGKIKMKYKIALQNSILGNYTIEIKAEEVKKCQN